MKLRLLLAAVSLLLAPLAARAQTSISTYGSWNNSNSISAWGGTSTSTYGETFVAPSGQWLQTVSFSILNNSANNIPFQAYVYAWNGTTITGSALFSGAVSNVPGSASFQSIAVSTGNLNLNAGQQYVAFYTTTTTGATQGGASWGYLGTGTAAGSDGYSGGNFVFNNSTTFSSLSSGWQNPTGYGGQATHDLAFS